MEFDHSRKINILQTMKLSLEKNKLKEVIKESISEVFEQKKDYFMHIFEEVIEDKLFIEAIKEGESSDSVSRDEVFNTLNDGN